LVIGTLEFVISDFGFGFRTFCLCFPHRFFPQHRLASLSILEKSFHETSVHKKEVKRYVQDSDSKTLKKKNATDERQ
jgi:hypothetical protein